MIRIYLFKGRKHKFSVATTASHQRRRLGEQRGEDTRARAGGQAGGGGRGSNKDHHQAQQRRLVWLTYTTNYKIYLI